MQTSSSLSSRITCSRSNFCQTTHKTKRTHFRCSPTRTRAMMSPPTRWSASSTPTAPLQRCRWWTRPKIRGLNRHSFESKSRKLTCRNRRSNCMPSLFRMVGMVGSVETRTWLTIWTILLAALMKQVYWSRHLSMRIRKRYRCLRKRLKTT